MPRCIRVIQAAGPLFYPNVPYYDSLGGVPFSSPQQSNEVRVAACIYIFADRQIKIHG